MIKAGFLSVMFFHVTTTSCGFVDVFINFKRVIFMKHKKLLALPVLCLAMSGQAQAAATLPALTPISGLTGAPNSADWSFYNRSVNVSVASNGASGYTLTATGAANFSFYAPNYSATYAGTASSYVLTANFDSTGHFVAGSGNELKIVGSLASTQAPAGASFPGTLFDASLTAFGYDSAHQTIGFNTAFDSSSWATNNSAFTGGSTAETVYLFDPAFLAHGTSGSWNTLVTAFANQDLGSLAGKSFVASEVAAVPLPLPAVLFGTGLTALFGFKRRSAKQA
jgi:hypothetical protein